MQLGTLDYDGGRGHPAPGVPGTILAAGDALSRAGLFERAVKRCGLDRSAFAVTDLRRGQLDDGALANLDRIVAEARPKVILALGTAAMKALTGMEGDVSAVRGYVFDSARYPGTLVLPTYHPTFLRGGKARDADTGARTERAAGKAGMHLFGVLCFDMQKAVAVARDGLSFEPPCYIEQPSINEARNFLAQVRRDPDAVITYDIETPGSATRDEVDLEAIAREIYQIQFSVAPGTGICLPWSGEFIDIAKEILATPNPKAGHNSRKFDDPILRAAGVTLNGRLDDTMEMWQRLQPDLPAGLQFVASFFHFPFAWKHLAATQPEFYGCADADAAQWLIRALPQALRARGAYRSYERHVREFDPILVRMCERGLPINNARREQFGQDLEARGAAIESDIQAIIPDSLRQSHPRAGYKIDPKDTTGLVKRTFTVSENGVEKVAERWCRLQPFNSNSGVQILSYIRHRRTEEIEALVAHGRTREWAEAHAAHRVPRNRHTAADTSAKLELVKLAKATGDPLYMKVIERREIQKMISTYVKGYAPGPDGRIHSHFFHATGTGQLSSRHPNIQNVPKHSELAHQFRNMIEADPGHWLVEFDFKSAHALTLGFEAQDPDYMRLARIDMHSFLAAAGLLRLWTPEYLLGLSDDDLAEKLRWVKRNHKQVRDRQAKPAILGYGFGMGAGTLLHNTRTASVTGPRRRR